MLEKYLLRAGWHKNQSKYRALNKFTCKIQDDDYEVLVPDSGLELKISHQKFFDEALSIIAQSENKDLSSFKYLITKGWHDLHRIKISQKENLTTKLGVAKSVIEGISNIFHESAFLEIDTNPKKEADIFIESCNFCHTYKGSFGFQIETPVGNGVIELLDNSAPDPIGRLVSKRISSGFRSLTKSVEISSIDPLLENSNIGFNGRICKTLSDMSDEFGVYDGEYSIYWSPIQSIESEFLNAKGNISRKAGALLYKASLELLKDEREFKNVTFVGFVEMVKSEKPFFDQDGDRIIAVKGECNEIGKTSLRFEVDIEEYKIAYDAHGKSKVMLKCDIRKRPKGWEVMKLYSIQPMND